MSLRNSLIFSVRWHRRIGLLCLFFVLVLSVTGILLNHTSSLKLDSIKLRAPILTSLYGLPSPAPLSVPIADQWLSHDGLNQLYLGETAIAKCQAPLLGAVYLNGLLQVLCDQELLLLSSEGELLESITAVLGLPAGVRALTKLNNQLLIDTANGTVIADLDSLHWTPTELMPEQWPSPQRPPPPLHDKINTHAPSIDLEQLLLDLHSGRLFGTFGVLVMDLAAVLLIVLSLTGLIAWNSSRKIKKIVANSRRSQRQR